MTFEQIIFYFFATVLLGAATMVVSAKNPVHSALFLVLAFFTAAALWILIEAEFLGIVLVLVYVGAVMVLFLFVVMMLNMTGNVNRVFNRYLPIGLSVALVLVTELIILLTPDKFVALKSSVLRHDADYNNTAEIGKQLYTTYVYAFEIAAVILLVAIIAAIVLTMRKRPGVRKQDPAHQVMVQAKDRVRIVEIIAEKRDC